MGEEPRPPEAGSEGGAPHDGEERAHRRRRFGLFRRFRRKVPRPLRKFLFRRVVAELLLVALVLVVIAGWFVQTPAFREHLRRYLEVEATLALRRPVTIGEVRTPLTPPRLELRNVVIANDPRLRQPFAEAEVIVLRPGWTPIDDGGAAFQTLRVRRAVVRLHRFDDGTWNFPKLVPSGEPSTGGGIRIERIQVFDSRVFLAGTGLPATFETTGFAADWLETGNDRHRLTLSVPKVRFRRDGQAMEAALRLAGEIRGRGERIRIDELELRSTLGNAFVRGDVARGAKLAKGAAAIGGTAKLEELDRFLRLGAKMSGEVAFDGALRFTPASPIPRFAGRASAADLRIRGIRARDVLARVDAAATGWTARLERARIGSGTLTGTAEGKPGSPVRVALRGRDLETAPLLGAFAPTLPRIASRIDLDAEASGGTTLASWTGRGTARLETAPGTGIPISGRIEAALADARLRIAEAVLHAPSVDVRATGALGAGEALRATATTSDLAATMRLVTPFLPADVRAAIPRLEGRGEATGVIRAERFTLDRFPSLAIDADASGTGVVVDGHAVGTVSGGIAIREGWLELENVVSRLPNGESLRVAGKIGPYSPLAIDLDVVANRYPASTVLGIIHLDFLKIAGGATGRLRIAGPVRSLDGTGPITIDGGTFWGQTVDRISALLEFDRGELTLSNVDARVENGSLSGTARFGPERFDFSASYKDVPLARLAYVGPLIPEETAAKTTGRAQGGGSYSKPAIRVAGDAAVASLLEGRLQKLSVPYTFELAEGRLEALVSGPGELRVTFDTGATAAGSFREGRFAASLGDFAPYRDALGLPADVPFHGGFSLTGTIDLAGAGGWSARGRLDEFHVELGGETLALETGGEITADRNRIALSETKLVGSVGEILLAGAVEPQAGPALDARLAGELDVRLFRRFLPAGTSLDGDLAIDLRADGTFEKPLLYGSLEIAGGRLRATGLLETVEDIEGRIELRGDRITTESLRARVGEGTLSIAGTARLDGFVPAELRARIFAENVAIRRLEGLDLVGDGELIATGGFDRLFVRGEVTLTRAVYHQDLRLNLEELLARKPESVGGAVSPWMDDIELEVRLRAPGTLAVRNNLAKLTGSADLVLRGTLGHPALLGQVTVAEGGEVEIQDVTYEVTSGTIYFTDPFRVDPVFDIAAQTEIRGYLVRVNLTGSLRHFTPTFSSDPPLSETNILYLLLAGQTPEETAVDSAQTMQSRLAAATQRTLSALTLEQLTRRGKELFGLDRFAIDPVFAENQIDSAKLTVGKQISERLSVTYTYSPQSQREQLLILEYRLGKGTFLQATRDADGVLGVDLKVRRRY